METSGNVGEAELDGRALKSLVECKSGPRFIDLNCWTTYKLAWALSWASVNLCFRAVCRARKSDDTTLRRRV